MVLKWSQCCHSGINNSSMKVKFLPQNSHKKFNSHISATEICDKLKVNFSIDKTLFIEIKKCTLQKTYIIINNDNSHRVKTNFDSHDAHMQGYFSHKFVGTSHEPATLIIPNLGCKHGLSLRTEIEKHRTSVFFLI